MVDAIRINFPNMKHSCLIIFYNNFQKVQKLTNIYIKIPRPTAWHEFLSKQ